jgi:hypothetical protein
MINARVGVSAGDKIATYHENQTKIEIPDTSFHTKGMLRNLIESQCYDMARKDQKYEALLQEVLRLQKQRNEDLITMNHQKDTIIELYSRINKDSDFSPLTKAS